MVQNRLLLRAHCTEGRGLLVARVAEARINPEEALDTGLFTAEVRARKQAWIKRGIRSAPTLVFKEHKTVMGDQLIDAFKTLIRKLVG
ncbi:hypothetical protein [Pseudomonas agarici]|uniref:hypothetical protein n=1 Tax=Pseudomonas agarici TaxID=46677 RepID=UPI0015A38C2F|nr:hypothetical protein [Pseudomonas agarici]NWB89981.1 hypothetical protein [Pseudomonas agarici]